MWHVLKGWPAAGAGAWRSGGFDFLHQQRLTSKFIKFRRKPWKTASRIENLGKKQLDKPLSQYKNIILKENQINLNFEEAAFLDFMIGKHAQEIVGHEKSSFSLLLNSAHKTNNHYNRQFTK